MVSSRKGRACGDGTESPPFFPRIRSVLYFSSVRLSATFRLAESSGLRPGASVKTSVCAGDVADGPRRWSSPPMNISCCVAFFSGAPGSGSCDDEDVGAGEGEEDGEDEDGGEDGGLDADGKLAEANSRRVRSDVAEPTCTCSWMVSTVRTPRWSWRRRTPDSSHRTPRYDTDEQRFAVFCMSSVGRSPYRFIFPATTRMRGDTCMLLIDVERR